MQITSTSPVADQVRDAVETAVEQGDRMSSHATSIEDRPTTAAARRAAAVGVWMYVHRNADCSDTYSDEAFAAMLDGARRLRTLGRTDRWTNAVDGLCKALVECRMTGQTDWAIVQYSIFAIHAA